MLFYLIGQKHENFKESLFFNIDFFLATDYVTEWQLNELLDRAAVGQYRSLQKCAIRHTKR
jgi:hypothetical protein